MKFAFVTSLGLSLLSISAFAMPAVGDHAEYDVTVTTASGSFSAVETFDLTAFDATTGYTEKATATYNGQSNSTEQQVPATQLVTDAIVTYMLAHCAEIKGTPASLTTPVGIIPTCAVAAGSGTNTGTAWVGNVPFGTVKQDTTDSTTGERTVLTIKAFHNG